MVVSVYIFLVYFWDLELFLRILLYLPQKKKKRLDRSYIYREKFKNKYYIKETCVLPYSFGNNCKDCINNAEYMIQYNLIIKKNCVSGVVIHT